MGAFFRVAVASLCLVLVSSCFEIEQTVNLKPDMSGEAGVTIGVDFEPMVLIGAMMKRSMEGLEGPPTAEELAAARKDFLEKSTRESKSKTEAGEQIAAEMPEGLKLLDFAVQEEDLRIRTNFRFAFDKLSRLTELALPQTSEDPTRQNVIDEPFAGLDITETPELLTLRTTPKNPAEAVEGQTEGSVEMDQETEALFEDAMKNLRVAWRITAPFPVVSHNATRVEGQTLIWEYDYQSFKKMDAAGVKQVPPIEAVFRKK